MISLDFKPPWWLRNPHLQTLWGPCLRRLPPLKLQRQRLETPDDDFVDLDWYYHAKPKGLVVLLHGLQGSSSSHYIQGMQRALHQQNLSSVVVHFRGCSGEPNRQLRCYHAGFTDDLEWLIPYFRRHDYGPLMAIGYSLGGSVLLHWLSQHQMLAAAAVVSPPFQLRLAMGRLQQGFSRLYQYHLLRQMKQQSHHKLPPHVPIRTLYDFDNHGTAPWHNFASAEDYYQRNSCLPVLKTIQTPTLLIHAQDDPFMTRQCPPRPENLSPAIQFYCSQWGGHVGFIDQQGYWLERVIPAFLTGYC